MMSSKGPCLAQAIENAEITTGILMPTQSESATSNCEDHLQISHSNSSNNHLDSRSNSVQEQSKHKEIAFQINSISSSSTLPSSLSSSSILPSSSCFCCASHGDYEPFSFNGNDSMEGNRNRENEEKKLNDKCKEIKCKDCSEVEKKQQEQLEILINDSSLTLLDFQIPMHEDPLEETEFCNFVETLPSEIVHFVLSSFLERNDRRRLRLTCQNYRKIVDNLFPLVLHLREREESAVQLEAYKHARAFLAMSSTLNGVNFRGRVDLTKYRDMFAVEFANVNFLDLSYHDGVTNSLLTRLPLSLKSLNIRGCNKIDNEGLRSLHYLENLEYLSLRACTKITDEGLELLPPKLENLDIEDLSKITSIGFSYFPSTLKSLNASCCAMVDDECIKNLPRIMHVLNFSNCEKITDEGLSHLPSGLRSLNLAACRKITNRGVEFFPKTLRTLDLGSCIKLTDGGLKNLPPYLIHLDAPSCNVSDEIFKTLPRSLIRLNLSWCKRVNGDGIRDLPSSIQFLDLSFCRKIKDDGLCFLPSKLTFLSLTYCPITGEGLKNLPPNLEHLSLNNCSNITDSALKHLPKNLKRLSILHCLLLSNTIIEALKRTSLMVDR
eukprot:TRINITY_DN23_c0_g1_i2.p1 TRINITY_DN23_c0_g1~~TRINITY_DN23_c0_g1_i2.p1  ORF type:complete len:607 (-),score=193.76 TRINITY_DN23_c0_g1_i2:347-2167(-)